LNCVVLQIDEQCLIVKLFWTTSEAHCSERETVADRLSKAMNWSGKEWFSQILGSQSVDLIHVDFESI
jgi:hypothetical protein